MAMSWPQWPQTCPDTERGLLEVARSGQWTISGPSTGEPAMERRFAAAFAEYVGAAFAVPVSHGTAALTIALEALGVGAGDEVLVPALGWVACSSAVVAVGADPVFVDVDLETFGMSTTSARTAITERTRALVIVHLLGAPADLDGLTGLAEEHDLFVVEDSSQAHGGSIGGRVLGTFGHVGAFSLQQSKLLTCGEGGVAVTSDPLLHGRLQELRADGRAWRETLIPGYPELEERDGAQGHNYAMSAFQAAVASAGLAKLDQQLERRRESAARLDVALLETGVAAPVRRVGQLERAVFWRYGLVIPGVRRPDLDVVEQEIGESLGCDVYGLEPPLHRHPLYRPQRTRRRSSSDLLRTAGVSTPNAESAFESVVTLPHRLLLGDPDLMPRVAQVVAAAAKATAT